MGVQWARKSFDETAGKPFECVKVLRGCEREGEPLANLNISGREQHGQNLKEPRMGWQGTMQGADNDAPREARTPDLEVNGLTL